MPTFANYNVHLCDWTGAKLTMLHTSGLRDSDFLSIAWQKRLNGPGVYRAEFVAETGTKDLFRVDYGLLVERDYGAGYYEEYYGLHHDSEEWLTSGDVDEHYWASMGQSPEWLLDQPLLQPLPSANPDRLRYDMWWQHGPADDIVKQMASESMGGGAETDRQVSGFAVEGYAGAGAWSCHQGRYTRLLQSMQDTMGEDGSLGLCDFRVVRVSGGFELRTYAPFYGTDRRRGHSVRPTVFSLELENVLNPKRQVIRHGEVTVALGGWTGGKAERAIYQRTNPAALAESPFRRREEFYDLRDVAQPDVIDGLLDQYLINDGRRENVEFDPIQTGACLYGRDWNLGDLVTLDLWGNSYDMRITEVLAGLTGRTKRLSRARRSFGRGERR
ncbi:MAG: hypothetical protein EHM35_00130 [Planctomycetaceae bacterium]|nr:MAG: hypothetical protein EHM35_00130 [Planctomycetaceae bacterium]